MRSSRLARLWCVILSLGLGAVALDAQRASFRSAIDLILLNVSVTNSGGQFAADLSADDFQVLEEGRPQELTFFSSAETPMSVSLVLDTSSSMDEQLPVTKRAALDFVGRLRPRDMAQIVTFDSSVEVIQPFTADRALLTSAIRGMRAAGSTSLYNALYIVLKELAKVRPQADAEIRRQVIVVLSDGDDTASLVTFEHLLDVAKRSQTAIYTIALGMGASAGPLPNGEFALRHLAQETGGRLMKPVRSTDLADVYTQIAQELTSQYVLGYLSSNARMDGKWRSVAVQLRRPNLQARTRPGYYAPTP